MKMRRKRTIINKEQIQEYTRKHCKHKIYWEDYILKAIAVKKTSLILDFQEPIYQLYVVTTTRPPQELTGFICCVSLNSGHECYFRPEDILGIVFESYLPEWAMQNRDELIMLIDKNENI